MKKWLPINKTAIRAHADQIQTLTEKEYQIAIVFFLYLFIVTSFVTTFAGIAKKIAVPFNPLHSIQNVPSISWISFFARLILIAVYMSLCNVSDSSRLFVLRNSLHLKNP